MRIDRLRHLAVVDPDSACRIGTVTGYWIDASGRRVAALAIRPVDADLPQRVAAGRVAHVGRQAVMLAPAGPGSIPNAEPPPDRWLDRRQLTSLIVYTDTGDRVGRVAGAEVDPASLVIRAFELARPIWRRWLPGATRISPESVAWCGRDVLVVRTPDPAKLRPPGQEDGERYQLAQPPSANGQARPIERVGVDR